MNTCDENADCIDTQDSYTCQCYPGFVDVSSSANLQPGRVCTVQTTCPKQKTDLMFLIDGSGSIGSYVFKNEVLRFVKEFVELFDIGLDNTRVGLIQYSDQIRHEFDLSQFTDKASVVSALSQVQYLTGLTRLVPYFVVQSNVISLFICYLQIFVMLAYIFAIRCTQKQPLISSLIVRLCNWQFPKFHNCFDPCLIN
ncbi:unnamed protein product [Gongylonema pulchrum]|uniref:VWFA domain-containing protein n=2 Tax=Gongylonema pulchrum TaxID=637853 RepID=A0A3P6RKS2_9BILA|nr:unnamed protein product [Gongylonema pulchrum]